jgi:hypothetical protein
MATKRKAAFPARLYERGWTGGDPDEALTLKPLNEAIPERGFQDAEFIPGLPNRLVADLIWPKICKNQDEGRDWNFREALKMRSVSKFWVTFIDQTDVVLDMHCSFILKKSTAERAAAPGRFRHWRPRLVL